ncbi:MAG: metal ABC transporter ATP-binding protein [Candidatus Riflebacteria bacterium]|nr:metal ABC transporter ATP-binding protein [Candidatus Riflebacteria bacterium]
MKPVVEFSEVFFSFEETPVLKNITLDIQENDFACIVGPNGGGKTTFLRLVLGMLKPQSGYIKIFGDKPSSARPRIGYVPQHARYDPKFPVRVLDVALMGRLSPVRFWGGFTRSDNDMAIDALREVGMADCAERPFANLSGGQRQRVLVARALVSAPGLLLLDEPTANIDIHGSEYLYDLLQKLNQRMTILLVSHDLGFVSQYVKSVICIRGEAVVHPTSQINGEIIKNLYGGETKLIRHDHRCSHEGHSC